MLVFDPDASVMVRNARRPVNLRSETNQPPCDYIVYLQQANETDILASAPGISSEMVEERFIAKLKSIETKALKFSAKEQPKIPLICFDQREIQMLHVQGQLFGIRNKEGHKLKSEQAVRTTLFLSCSFKARVVVSFVLFTIHRV